MNDVMRKQGVMWKQREKGMDAELTPSWETYAEAMNKFTQSAKAFMEHLYLLTEARQAYEEAMAAGAAMRSTLDSGDKVLRTVRAQLAEVVNKHSDEPTLPRRKPQLQNGSSGGNAFP